MRMLTVILIWLLATTAHSSAGEQRNAALGYWRSFALMPEQPELIAWKERVEDVDQPDWKLDPALHDAFRDAFDDSIAEFAKSSQEDHCDFGIDHSQGPNAFLSHLSPMRVIVCAALAEARICMDSSRPDRAKSMVSMCLRASRHLTQDKTTLSSMLAGSLLSRTLKTINFGLDANAWNPSQLNAIFGQLESFDSSDPTQLQQSTILSQRRLVEWMRNDLKEGGSQTEKFISMAASLRSTGSLHQDPQQLTVTPEMLDQYSQFLDVADKAWSAENPSEAIADLEQRIGDNEFGPLTHRVAESLRRPLRERDDVARQLAETRKRLSTQLQTDGAPTVPDAPATP